MRDLVGLFWIVFGDGIVLYLLAPRLWVWRHSKEDRRAEMNFWNKIKDRLKPSRAYLRGYRDGYDNGHKAGWSHVIPPRQDQVHSYIEILAREGVWLVPEKTRKEKAAHG